jgi:hypothetical protein
MGLVNFYFSSSVKLLVYRFFMLLVCVVAKLLLDERLARFSG